MKKILLIVMTALAIGSCTRNAKDFRTHPGVSHADTAAASGADIDSLRRTGGADSVRPPQ